MITKRVISISLLLVVGLIASAQTQQGYVKTKGRQIGGKYYEGRRIGDVTVRVKDRSAVRSGTDGSFSFSVPGKKYSIQQVQKQGYVLHDQDVLYRQYEYSSNPLVLVMEDQAQLEADRRMLERQVRRVTDDELRRRSEEIDVLRTQNKISEEHFREQLQKLNSDYDRTEKLIKDLVEQYNKIDFDSIDEFNRRVSDCIISGRLREADSLVRSKGNFAHREAELLQLSDVNTTDRKALEHRESVERSLRYDLAQDYYQMYFIFKSQIQFDSAALYIEKRSRLDTSNTVWLFDCGLFFDYVADFDKALDYYNKSLIARKSELGETHPDIALLYNNIGTIYSGRGDFSMALKYHKKALSIRESIFGEKHPAVASSYSNVGSVYCDMGDYSRAMEYYNKALTINKSTLGQPYPDRATLYNNLGSVYLDQGDYTKALEYLTLSLNIDRSTLGEQHLDVATSYNNLGSVYCNQGNYDKALEYHNKALIIRKKSLGEKHPDVAFSYNNIGSVYCEQGHYHKAQECYSKALDILKEVLGEQHPEVARLYNNIGYNYYYQGDYIKALEYYNKTLSIWKSTLGENHTDVVELCNHIIRIEYEKSIIDGTVGSFCKSHCFVITVVDDNTPASSLGMNGEYVLWEFADWNQYSPISLFVKNNELRGKPKDIVVMKDGAISKYHFENVIGCRIDVKKIKEDEKQRIDSSYSMWKKKGGEK